MNKLLMYCLELLFFPKKITWQEYLKKSSLDRQLKLEHQISKSWSIAIKLETTSPKLKGTKKNLLLKNLLNMILCLLSEGIEHLFLKKHHIMSLNKAEAFSTNHLVEDFSVLDSHPKWISLLYMKNMKEDLPTRDRLVKLLFLIEHLSIKRHPMEMQIIWRSAVQLVVVLTTVRTQVLDQFQGVHTTKIIRIVQTIHRFVKWVNLRTIAIHQWKVLTVRQTMDQLQMNQWEEKRNRRRTRKMTTFDWLFAKLNINKCIWNKELKKYDINHCCFMAEILTSYCILISFDCLPIYICFCPSFVLSKNGL